MLGGGAHFKTQPFSLLISKVATLNTHNESKAIFHLCKKTCLGKTVSSRRKECSIIRLGGNCSQAAKKALPLFEGALLNTG